VRSLLKILAARASFFLRSRAVGRLVLCLISSVSGESLHTLVYHLLKVGGNLAAALAVGYHGAALPQSIN
jgi:hypothetical protein